MAQPFRLIRVSGQVQARNKSFKPADNDHDQQIRDHHHVNQAKDNQHDLLFGEGRGIQHQMGQFLEEFIDIDALRHDQAEIERQLQPARPKDQGG